MTSSIKKEIHSISLRRQRRTEPRPFITRTKKLVKIGRVVPKIWSRTDKHTHRDRHAHHNIPLPYRRRSNKTDSGRSTALSESYFTILSTTLLSWWSGWSYRSTVCVCVQTIPYKWPVDMIFHFIENLTLKKLYRSKFVARSYSCLFFLAHVESKSKASRSIIIANSSAPEQGRWTSLVDIRVSATLSYILHGVSLAGVTGVSCRRRWPPSTTLALTTPLV